MTVQPFVNRNRSYKPRPWNVKRGLVAPEYRWFWSVGEWEWLVPFWENGGPVHDYASKRRNNAYLLPATSHSWQSTPRGPGVLDDGSGTAESVQGIFTGIQDDTLFIDTEEWTTFGVFRPSTVTSDERAWVAKFNGNVANARQIMCQIDPDDAATPVLQVNMNAGNKLTGSTEVFADRTYIMFVRAIDGGSTVDMWAWEIEPGFAEVEQGLSYNHPGNDANQDEAEVTFGTRQSNGNRFLGDLLLEGYVRAALTEGQMEQLARDPFGPFRRTTYRFFTTAAGGGGGQTITRQIEDTFTFSETQNRDFDGNRILSESFTFSENLIAERSLTRIIEDTFSFAETLIRDLVLTRLPSDSFGFGENLVAKINGTVVGAAEAGTRFINQFSSLIKDQTLDDNVITDFVDGIFS